MISLRKPDGSLASAAPFEAAAGALILGQGGEDVKFLFLK